MRKICQTKDILLPYIQQSEYFIHQVYDKCQGEHPRFQWEIIFHRLSIPKTRFVLWIALNDVLKTKAKLRKVDVVMDDLCPLCGVHSETGYQLFVQCSFSRSNLQLLQS